MSPCKTPEGGRESELKAAKHTNSNEGNMIVLNTLDYVRNVTLSLLVGADHCQRVTGHLSRGKGHKTEEKQFGVTVVGRIAPRPVNDGLQRNKQVSVRGSEVFNLLSIVAVSHLMNCTLHSCVGDHAEDAGLESSVEGGQGLVSVNGSGAGRHTVVRTRLLQVQPHFQHLGTFKHSVKTLVYKAQSLLYYIIFEKYVGC